jgi:antitoxin component HigA of HigAB toxin-antitoxin module
VRTPKRGPYRWALSQIEWLVEQNPGRWTPAGIYLRILAWLVERYEKRTWPLK